MGFLTTIFGWLGSGIVKVLGVEVLQPILNSINTKTTAERDITLAGTEADKQIGLGTLQAAVEANKLKAASQSAYPLIVYLIAVPPAVHSAAVYFDSLPFWTPWGAHVVGAWGVPTPPGIYASMQQNILLSFFVVAPVVQAIRAGTAAIARR